MNEPKLERCNMTRDVLISRLEYFVRGGYTDTEEKHDLLREALVHLRCAPLPDNKALTVEELREMDWEPVWAEEINSPEWRGGERAKGWVLVRWDYSKTIAHSEHLGVALRLTDYSKTWIAYRRQPEKRE